MKLVTYDRLYIDNITRKRQGEIRLGEKVKTLPWGSNFPQQLSETNCRYVLLGLPEDIGVRANGGRGGTYSAWLPVLNTLLNTQSNHFLSGEEILVLGHIDFTDVMTEVRDFDFHKNDDLSKARRIVSDIDASVVPVIRSIIESGKEPIIIGGGHNNAYPCIKGAAEGLMNAGKIKSAAINVINCDAHSDFRPIEGRHSGNPFSYAFKEKLLEKYAVIGLHESYNTDSVVKDIKENKDRIHYSTFEDIFIREKLSFDNAVTSALDFTKGNYTGLEIDLDAIQNIPSSAKTSSGISTIEARKYVHRAATSGNIIYFHIAEAAPVLSHIKTDLKTGKLVTYLITDYIKGRNEVMKYNQQV